MNEELNTQQSDMTADALKAYQRRRRFRMISGLILGVALLVVLVRGIYVVIQVSSTTQP